MTLSKFTKREIIRNLFVSSAVFAFFLGYDLMSHNTKGAVILGLLIAAEQIVVLVVWRSKTKEDVLKKKRQEFELQRKLWNDAVEKVGEIPPEDLPKYNGGLTHIDWGNGSEELGVNPLKFRLPIPENGMKWAIRLRDTEGGDILSDLVQVPKDEENSGWRDGFPKYE